MENALAVKSPAQLSASSPEAIALLNQAEEWLGECEQLPIKTKHAFHGGMYTRTVTIPKYSVVIGALVKIPTLLILNGYGHILVNNRWEEFYGPTIRHGAAGRKQAFRTTYDEVDITMIFPTQATTVDQAEREFTNEYEKLMSRK